MNTFKITAAVTLLMLSAACHKPITVFSPSQPASVEQQVYADLVTAQTALEDLKSEAVEFPEIKTQLNQAIASYNVANQAFLAYEKSKNINVAHPQDILDLQVMVLALEAHIQQLGESFKPAAAAKESK